MRNKLNAIFEKQLTFQKMCGHPYSDITSSSINKKESLSDRYILAMIDELIEFRNCLNKKEWEKKRFKINRKHLLEELADVWLFVINLSVLWNVKPSVMLSVIINKQKINDNRLMGKNKIIQILKQHDKKIR